MWPFTPAASPPPVCPPPGPAQTVAADPLTPVLLPSFLQAGRDYPTRTLSAETEPELIGAPAPPPAPAPLTAEAPAFAVTAADGPSGITLAQLAENNTPGSCWLAVNGQVYDLTEFAPSHPGGRQRGRRLHAPARPRARPAGLCTRPALCLRPMPIS